MVVQVGEATKVKMIILLKLQKKVGKQRARHQAHNKIVSIEGFDVVTTSITIEKSARIFHPSITTGTSRPEAPPSALAADIVSESEAMCLDYSPPPPSAC